MLVNLVTSGFFISFLIGAKNYFEENLKKKGLQTQNNSKVDFLNEEMRKGKVYIYEKFKGKEIAVPRIRPNQPRLRDRFEHARVFAFDFKGSTI